MNPLNLEFTSKMIEEELELKANTLHYYIQAGGINPDIDAGSGTGHTRKFSATNFFQAGIIKVLMGYGLPKRSIVAMMKSIIKSKDENLLNPQKFLDRTVHRSNQVTAEFLIFFPDSSSRGGFVHRFVTDSNLKNLEHHSCIIINLDLMFQSFFMHMLFKVK